MVVPVALPPEFGPGALLTQWNLDPLTILPIVVAGWLYAVGLRRVARSGRALPRSRPVAFFAGLGTLVVALASPIDVYADVLFSVHMGQHLLLLFVAPPLLALGAPVTLALRAAGPGVRRLLARALRSRPVSVLAHPIAAWLAFAGAPVLIHVTALYQSALENAFAHAFEHGLLLGAGLLYWWAIVGADPSPRRPSYPVRMLMLAVAMPAGTFLGLAIFSAGAPLYAGYEGLPEPWGPSSLTDQRTAGAMMWVLGNLALILAMLLVAVAWKGQEERAQDRAERTASGGGGR